MIGKIVDIAKIAKYGLNWAISTFPLLIIAKRLIDAKTATETAYLEGV